jgi:hypothetical protein
MRLARVIFRILMYGLIGAGLTLFMTFFVQHQPDVLGGMNYLYFWAVPLTALGCGFMCSLQMRDYLYPEAESE